MSRDWGIRTGAVTWVGAYVRGDGGARTSVRIELRARGVRRETIPRRAWFRACGLKSAFPAAHRGRNCPRPGAFCTFSLDELLPGLNLT